MTINLTQSIHGLILMLHWMTIGFSVKLIKIPVNKTNKRTVILYQYNMLLILAYDAKIC